MWELDDGIIQGALETRYASEQGVRIRREEGTGESDDLWRYHMILQEDINE